METNNFIPHKKTNSIIILTSIVYTIGISYNISYYYQFGINIIQYFTLQEISISALYYIIVIISLYIIFSYTDYLLRPTTKQIYSLLRLIKNLLLSKLEDLFTLLKGSFQQKTTNKITYDKVKFYTQKLYCKKDQSISLISLATAYAILYIIIPYLIYTNIIRINYKILTTFLILSVSIKAHKRYIKEYKKIKHRKIQIYYNKISASIILSSMIICSVLLGIHNAKLDMYDSKFDFSIKTKNGTEFSNNKFNLIKEGKTIFILYHKQEQYTLILNTDNIESIKYYGSCNNTASQLINELNLLEKELTN